MILRSYKNIKDVRRKSINAYLKKNHKVNLPKLMQEELDYIESLGYKSSLKDLNRFVKKEKTKHVDSKNKPEEAEQGELELA